ncbi:hypothetical protein EMPS_00407 [Entomortierella parvispora]|uniref:Uncharacterized protein n=1 Tax=Entomortierella parvispora TaxID=205924 RepID=A0A9P3H0T6_9FUNG|nr:hypothetical protein EMPS_00407 [Entomortierella parvispora]
MSANLKISLDEPYLVLPGEGLIVPTLSQEEMIQALSSINRSSSSSLASSSISTSDTTLLSASSSSLSNSTISSMVPPHLIASNDSNSRVRSKYTTPLTGSLIFQITKPTRVLSNARISLSGISHLALLGTFGKRSHTFQTHLDISQSLPLQPPSLAEALDSGRENREQSSLDGSSTSITAEGERTVLLQPGTIKVPFILHVPNLSPPSIATPEGGTYYRLTAKVVLDPSSTNLVHKLKSKLSIGSQSDGNTIEAFTVLQIYRAPRPRCLYVQASAALAEERAIAAEAAAAAALDAASTNMTDSDAQQMSRRYDLDIEAYNQELENNANDLVPVTIHDLWPCHCECSVSIPFTQFLKESDPPELRVRISILSPETIQLKSFQVALWERAIYRVQKRKEEEIFEAAVLAGIVDPFASRKRYVVGIRERAVHAQRADAYAWVPVEQNPQHSSSESNSAGGVPVATYYKRFAFTVPDPSCPNEKLRKQGGGLWGNTNSSTYTHVSKLKRVQRYEEDKEIKDEEFGKIHIEIQHFVRYTLRFMEQVMGLDRKTKKMAPHLEEKERVIGQVPVILHGVPTGPESDRTGLPSYLTSRTSKEVSAETERSYEEEAMGLLEGTLTNLPLLDHVVSRTSESTMAPISNVLRGESQSAPVDTAGNQEQRGYDMQTPAALPSYTESMNAERDQLSFALESKQGYPGS